MNDFTKEELMNILYALEHLYEPSFDLPKMYLLRNKVESMIDNYCDHEWENICCQCTMDKIYCHKCEKDMGDLKERYPDE